MGGHGAHHAGGPISDRAADGHPADIGNAELDLVRYYSQTLGAPCTGRPAGSLVVRQGRRCSPTCTAPVAMGPACRWLPARKGGWGRSAPRPLWPYTDLLLLDLGPGLDDGVAEGDARSREWPTAPLWGLGLTQRVNPRATFLHDSRPRSLEEAILWHGGEAQGSQAACRALAPRQRQALLQGLAQL